MKNHTSARLVIIHRFFSNRKTTLQSFTARMLPSLYANLDIVLPHKPMTYLAVPMMHRYTKVNVLYTIQINTAYWG